ncbi:MAG TPA: hypothetical protein VK741_22830 [Acetobacteraceae bacterium]|nr:hypothetical protein [Acetobacteraceae bacterium]
MSGNTSATGGFVTDQPPRPPSGAEITAAMQQMIVNLAVLPGSLVRPRWQPMPPAQPSAATTWAAVGVAQIEADEYPYIRHHGGVTLPGQTAPGYDELQRHATLTVLASFYGPGAEEAAGAVRDGLYIQQNMEPFSAIGAKLLAVHDLARNPEIMNQQYVDRIDMRLEFRAQFERVYPIFDLAAADVVLKTDTGISTDVSVTPGSQVTWDDGATRWDEGSTYWRE